MKNADAELIEAFLDGDEGAFTKLVRKHEKAVHALAWRKVGDFQAAEEITQDAFVKVYHKLSTLKNRNQFAGWLYVITDRLCIEWHRKKRVPMASLEAMAPGELEEHYYSGHLAAEREAAVAERKREAVKQILRRLPESERTVVSLHYLGEKTCEEIGESLGVSTNTVKSRLHRARKRLKAEAESLREVLGDVSLPAMFTGNILRAVARATPPAPSGGNPLVPWAVSLSTAVLLFLLAGLGAQHLLRFQRPYSFAADSAMTVEIVDAPVSLALQAKPALRTRLGNTAEPGRHRGAGSRTDALLATAAADDAQVLDAAPRWHQTNGPSGGFIVSLFVTSKKELYAAGSSGLYKLSPDRTVWSLVNASLPILTSDTAMFTAPMGERDETLYIACEAELFASTDGGETWRAVGPRPSGRVLALLVTDDAFYLALAEGIFQSKDAGKSWKPVWEGLGAVKILSAVAIENTVFVGTERGLYRLDTGKWEKLPGVESHAIIAMAVAENRVYLSAEPHQNNLFKTQRLFCSTNKGDSWREITPTEFGLFSPLKVGRAKLVAIGETVLAIGFGVLCSSDSGETWTHIASQQHGILGPMSPIVALDEDTFFVGGFHGISHSTDGGHTWHPLRNGVVQTRVTDVARVNDVLYAATTTGVFQSIDGGAQWTSVPIKALPDTVVDRLVSPKLEKANGTLYVKVHHLGKTYLLRLDANGEALEAVEGVSAFGDDVPRLISMHAAPTSEPTLGDDGVREFSNRFVDIVQKTAHTEEFAVSGDTLYFVEARRLFRWRLGEETRYDIGVEDTRVRAFERIAERGLVSSGQDVLVGIPIVQPDMNTGFQLAASANVVYVGKRDGCLLQSLDEGATWRDVTASLPGRFASFKEITFAGSTVFVATGAGVVASSDGKNWHAVTDALEARLVMNHLAIDGLGVYGVSAEGAYRLKRGTLTWVQVASDIPTAVTSFAADGGVLYVGTEGRGVLRLQLNGR